MTNMEYIIGKITERDLAELYVNGLTFSWNLKGNLNKKVHDAFYNWQRDTDRPNRNFTVEGELDPSVWEWSKIHNHKTDKWDIKGRTTSVAFQQWLCFQYDESTGKKLSKIGKIKKYRGLLK